VRKGFDAYPRGKWTNQQLEKAMDAIKKGLTSMRKTNKHWNIPLSSLSNHLNRRTHNDMFPTP
jgi:hypothetical protein